MKLIVEGMDYFQWRHRNSLYFKQLNLKQRKQVVQMGYHNVGWEGVQKSWRILQVFFEEEKKVVNLVDVYLERGDLSMAIEQLAIRAENINEMAEEGLKRLRRRRNTTRKNVQRILEKYKPL